MLCDLEPPALRAQVETIRTLRSRYPQLPLVALVATLSDLVELFGTVAWPLHVLPKPIILGLFDELLRLAGSRTRPAD